MIFFTLIFSCLIKVAVHFDKSLWVADLMGWLRDEHLPPLQTIMFGKAWTYITDKFRRDKPQPTVLLPFARTQPTQAETSPSTLAFSLPQPMLQQQPPEFKVVVLGSTEPTVSEEQGLAQEVIDEVRELEQRLKNMTICERRLEEINQTAARIDQQRRPASPPRHRQLARHPSEYRQEYQTQIVQFRQCKYSGQLEDFPLIPYESFQRIQQFWREKKRSTQEIKKTGLKTVEKLTFKAMGGVDHGEWLNDDIINIIIELMEKQLPQEGTLVLNSYFATTILNKTDNVIARHLKKRAIERTHTLLMPVNNNNHWYFAKFDPNTRTLTIFDSLRKSPQVYLSNPIFKSALKFAHSLYNEDFTLLVSEDYPQQQNGYDCGVFMLMGIRDSLRGRGWSFRQGDMRFKRVQLACEVFEEGLMVAV